MSSTPMTVPVCLQITAANGGSATSPNSKNNMQFSFDIFLMYTPQYGVNGTVYDLSVVTPGMWIGGGVAGYAWKIVSIGGIGTNGDGSTTITVEDVDNYNYLISGSNSYTSPPGNYIIFELNSNGVPVLQGLYNSYVDTSLAPLLPDIISRFANTSPNTQYIDIYQPNHTLLLGDPIWYNSSNITGQPYEKAMNSNAKYTIGVVSNTGVPDLNSFTFKVFGTYYSDVSSFFSETLTPSALSLAAISGVVPGSILYIDTTGTNQYTTTAPADSAIPIWIYLGLDPVTGKETGILMPFGGGAGGGGGGGGTADLSNILDADASDNILTKKISLNYASPTLTITGIGSRFLLQASHPNGSLISNFNFSTSATANAAAATITMSSKFGTTYNPGLFDISGNLLGTTTDTTGFQVVLNSKYTMANIPMIIGTVAYWQGSFLVYSQLKFGNTTGTTNSVQALLTPTLANLNTSTGPNKYGAPLTLSITGLSITSGAFGSARDISTSAPLKYAIQVYLEILN